MDKIKIVVATHKKYKMPTDKIYLPLQVGASLSKEDLGYKKDNIGDNISELNPYFCELTALYWAWKNLDAEYIGLNHYRRYFSMYRIANDKYKNIVTYTEILLYLGKIKVFLPKKRKYYIETLYSHYAHTHNEQHLQEIRKIIKEKYPEYIENYDKTLNKSYGYMFNMMIMRKDILEKYCKWLFDILFELKNKLHSKNESQYDKRFYGRLSELIFNVWLDYAIENKMIISEDIMELKVINIEKINWILKINRFLKAKFLNEKYTASF